MYTAATEGLGKVLSAGYQDQWTRDSVPARRRLHPNKRGEMKSMKRRHRLYVGVIVAVFLVAAGLDNEITGQTKSKAVSPKAKTGGLSPQYVVDPLWPKPLPNHWVLGSVTGVAVDSQDHIWIVHRGADSLGNNEKGAILNPPTGCCVPAPQVLEFDQAGNLVSHWGGPGQGFDWPQSTGEIAVDHKGNVWIAAAGPPPPARGGSGASTATPRPQDAHALKFSRTGQFLLQIGHAGKVEGSDSQTGLNRPAGVGVDPATGEAY